MRTNGVITSALRNSIYLNGVQRVSITIAGGATTGTATINTVSALAFIVYQGQKDTDTSFSATIDLANVQLTNTTTVTATRGTSDISKTVTIQCVVVDPKSALVSGVQQGTTTISAGTSATTAITSVDTALSAIFYLGQTSTGTTFQTSQARATLTNATTVTVAINNSGTVTVGWVVVTFQSAVINNIQQLNATFTTANAADTSTITSVVTANSMIAYGGERTSATADMYWTTLTNSTTVTYTRSGTGVSSRICDLTVIEFKAGVLKSIQRGSISLANAASNTATITGVNDSFSFANYTGILIAGGSGNAATILGTLTETNGTTLTAARNTSSANDTTVGYEAVEFN